MALTGGRGCRGYATRRAGPTQGRPSHRLLGSELVAREGDDGELLGAVFRLPSPPNVEQHQALIYSIETENGEARRKSSLRKTRS